MTLSPELREPTSYASEPQLPHVPEMEIVNDYARIVLHKGEPASLQSQIARYVEMYRQGLLKVNWHSPKNEEQLRVLLQECESELMADFESMSGLFLGQPLALPERSAFATISRADTSKGQWARVPDSWQLHGELGAPSTVWQRRENPLPGQANTILAPGLFLDNPVLITDEGGILELGDQFVIKIALSDSLTKVYEGVYREPSMRDVEL